MDVLDEEGRLFGVVNVIDALVVLVAFALVVGGVFVVLGDGSGEPEDEPPRPERYATLSYDVSLDSPAATLAVGDGLEGGDGNATVTDVHRSTTVNGTAHVTASIEYRGAFANGGDDLLAGDSVAFATQDARIQANVRTVGSERETTETTDHPVVLAVEPDSPGAAVLEPGDAVRVGGTQVATVDAVANRSGTGTHVGVTVTAREGLAGPTYGGQQLRAGEWIGLVTDDAVVRGQIVALDTSDPGDVR